jgi:hypothetical protein
MISLYRDQICGAFKTKEIVVNQRILFNLALV